MRPIGTIDHTVEIIDRILVAARSEAEIRNLAFIAGLSLADLDTDFARPAWANAAALLNRAQVTGKMAGLEEALAAAERWGRR